MRFASQIRDQDTRTIGAAAVENYAETGLEQPEERISDMFKGDRGLVKSRTESASTLRLCGNRSEAEVFRTSRMLGGLILALILRNLGILLLLLEYCRQRSLVLLLRALLFAYSAHKLL